VATGQLIDRVLDLLEFLAGFPDGLSLTDICKRRKLPKGAAHRILSGLMERGFIEQDEKSEYYRYTLKTTAIGFRYLAESGITDLCQPILDALAVKTGELSRLVIASGDTLTWVSKAQGAHSGLRYDADIGRPVVLHATAAGRAWLTTLDEHEALRIVQKQGFSIPKRFNRSIVTDERTLRAELRATSERGYGLAIEEGEAGMVAMACPIFFPLEKKTRAVGTVSIAGPMVRMTPKRIIQISKELKAAALEFSGIWPMRRFVEGASVSAEASKDE
jgi:IclR family transcriptional regulator, acetate operon repressor